MKAQNLLKVTENVAFEREGLIRELELLRFLSLSFYILLYLLSKCVHYKVFVVCWCVERRTSACRTNATSCNW